MNGGLNVDLRQLPKEDLRGILNLTGSIFFLISAITYFIPWGASSESVKGGSEEEKSGSKSEKASKKFAASQELESSQELELKASQQL